MADFNKFIAVGRLTRDPVRNDFQNGGAVANFGLAFTGQRVKNKQTGAWEDDPCFIDVKAFNKNEGRKLADFVMQYFTKGKAMLIEGRLVLEKWQDKQTGANRSKHVLLAYDCQFYGDKPKDGDGGSQGGGGYQNQGRGNPAPAQDQGGGDEYGQPGGGDDDDQIPF